MPAPVTRPNRLAGKVSMPDQVSRTKQPQSTTSASTPTRPYASPCLASSFRLIAP